MGVTQSIQLMPQVEDWQITTDVPSGMYLLFTAVGRRRFNFPPALLLLHSMPAHVFVRLRAEVGRCRGSLPIWRGVLR